MSLGSGRKPSIFVSSTCYDLSQIRTDIKLFIEGLGYEPILSEYDSYPIDPDISTLDNCLRVVQERADIFVLVVGGRYGSQVNNDKSITNMEYIRAKAKGIPIYIFINKSILSILKIWKSNPENDFNSVVDSPKLFEFVETLRGIDNVWVYGFENAQDITNILKLQFAYLFNDSLSLRNQIKALKLSKNLLRLKGEAFRIVVEKPIDWEFRLFGQIFRDGIEESSDLKKDLKYSITIGEGRALFGAKEIVIWIQTKINEILRLSDGLSTLINDVLKEALGLSGQPGDADNIVYVAEKVVAIYKETIKWTFNFRSVFVEEEWQGLINIVSELNNTLISDLKEYCDKWNNEVDKAFNNIAEQVNPVCLDLTFKFQEPNLSEFYEELNRLKVKYGIYDND